MEARPARRKDEIHRRNEVPQQIITLHIDKLEGEEGRTTEVRSYRVQSVRMAAGLKLGPYLASATCNLRLRTINPTTQLTEQNYKSYLKHQFTQFTTQPYGTSQCLATEQIPTTRRWKDVIREELEESSSVYAAYTKIWREGVRRQADGREHEIIPEELRTQA
eukprot:1733336-Amphidinium_carterae.2